MSGHGWEPATDENLRPFYDGTGPLVDRFRLHLYDKPAQCGCGQRDCDMLALNYPYCVGCSDHHRLPVGDPCPVDVGAAWYDDFAEPMEATGSAVVGPLPRTSEDP